MFSYFAIVPLGVRNADNVCSLISKIKEVHPQYKITSEIGGMIILTASDGNNNGVFSYSLANGAGTIIGTLFQRDQQSSFRVSPGILPCNESAKIIDTKGRHLIKNYWGRYTAFLFDLEEGIYTIVRDPTGAIPGYYIKTNEYLFFFSDSEHFARLKLGSLTVNLDHIVSHVRMPVIDYADTGFHEIFKVQRGHALSVKNEDLQESCYWHPSDFVTRGERWNIEEAAEQLRETIKDCVVAWASQFERVAVLLSGGLDSSIVLACLRQGASPPAIKALNYYSAGADEDERKWAMAMADHVNVELYFHENKAAATDISIVKDFIVHAEPGPCSALMTVGLAEKKFADEHKIDALFLGEGGDIIFHAGSPGCAQDYVWNHGLHPAYIKHCAYDAFARRRSLVEVFRKATCSYFAPPKMDMNRYFKKSSRSILNPAMEENINLNMRFMHWLSGLRNASYAKTIHITGTRFIDFYQWPNARQLHVQRIQPLLAQPVLELIYRIPTYMFALNGVDRGLARYAFQKLLPMSITRRQSKGGADTYHKEVYLQNADFLREHLIDGELVRSGIFDRKAVERALDLDISADSHAQNIVMGNIGLEMWLRKWKLLNA